MTTPFTLPLDPSSTIPLYIQLYNRIRTSILSGQLERGARLPSTRALAVELGISRSTITLAYEQLTLEGYLSSRVGHGTEVPLHLPDPASTPPPQNTTNDLRSLPLSDRAHSLRQITYPNRIRSSHATPFRAGEPALDLFPYALWARLVARHARHTLPRFATYQPPAGHLPLREAIAAHIGITRGVRCTPDRIVITSGSQGALDLAARTLLNPGDSAWVEDPGYFGAQGALLSVGASLAPVPVDDQGLDLASGLRLAPNVRLISTTPSHQFPTGVTMSLQRRLHLLDFAKNNNAWILEDDYDSEYRYSGRPLDSLQGLDHADRVLYIGTFSKVLFPALRIGYLVAPPDLIDPLLSMRRFIDTHVPILEQLALTDFITEGHYARHLRRMRSHYLRRRNLLHAELQANLSHLLEVHAPESGMHLVAWLPPGKDDSKAAALAAGAGIDVTPISTYAQSPLPRGGLIFGYASTSEASIPSAVEALARSLKHL